MALTSLRDALTRLHEIETSTLLENSPKPSHHEVRKALDGNLCRCTGYGAIFNAILQASGQDGVKPVMQ